MQSCGYFASAWSNAIETSVVVNGTTHVGPEM